MKSKIYLNHISCVNLNLIDCDAQVCDYVIVRMHTPAAPRQMIAAKARVPCAGEGGAVGAQLLVAQPALRLRRTQ